MAGGVSTLFCHPIKGVGRCRVANTDLLAGQTMADDRIWAVTHEASRFDPANPAWAACNNFMRAAKAPGLQMIGLSRNGAEYTLKCDGRPVFSFDPDDDSQHEGFINWLAQFIPANRARPKALVKAPAQGMTDSDFPSISILSTTSLAALAQAAGKPVEMERFRGNIWLDGFAPWAERGWVGKSIRIGGAEIELREQITRCMATTANPVSGAQDIATLQLLESNWGHRQFGLYGVVTKSGPVALNDKVELL